MRRPPSDGCRPGSSIGAADPAPEATLSLTPARAPRNDMRGVEAERGSAVAAATGAASGTPLCTWRVRP